MTGGDIVEMKLKYVDTWLVGIPRHWSSYEP